MNQTVVVLDYEEFLTMRDLILRGVFYADQLRVSRADATTREEMTAMANAGNALLDKLLGAERIDIMRPEAETRIDLLLAARCGELVGAASPET
jgi:hypothetical protein